VAAIYFLRLINFGVRTATRIAVASENAAQSLVFICNALPDNARERAFAEAKRQIEEKRAAFEKAHAVQARNNNVYAITFAVVVGVALLVVLTVRFATAAEQTRTYAPNGQSIGTAMPQGEGSVRYYDSRGNSLGTSTTNSTGTTTFYGPRGNVTGTAVAPARRK
jgi:hypothetical protein